MGTYAVDHPCQECLHILCRDLCRHCDVVRIQRWEVSPSINKHTHSTEQLDINYSCLFCTTICIGGHLVICWLNKIPGKLHTKGSP